MAGKLIVLEGLDGSGKATQAEMLYSRLISAGIKAKKISFPDYDSESSALIKMYLRGDFGKSPSDVDPCAASLFYTVDRFASYKMKWGEFYRKGDYETDKSHRFTTPAGDENNALILRYSAYSSNPTTPSRAYSITGSIQGMAINGDGDRIILSQSFGLKNSHILTYEFSSSNTEYSATALKINNSAVRMYYLDSANLVTDYEIPCMSEGLCSSGDKIYVLFESASKKYRAFVREQTDAIYSFRVRK